MKESLTSTTAGCKLTVTVVDLTPDLLRLTYSVYNHGVSALYLCNQLHAEAGMAANQAAIEPLPNMVHIQVLAEGVKIDKSIMDLSFHDGIAVYDIPFLTRLEPAKEYEQAIDLPLPLIPYKVYNSRPSPLPPTSLPLLFELGYFVESEEIKPFLHEVKTLTGNVNRIDSSMVRRQQLITAGPFQQSVPIIDGAGNGVKQAVSDMEWTPWG